MSSALDRDGCIVSVGYQQMDAAPMQVAAGSLEISADTQRVSANGIHILLRRAEFRLLFFFMSHPERVHSRGQLLNQVWNRKALVGVRTVDVHVRRLRAALEPFGLDCMIQTVHGSGYRFSATQWCYGERHTGAMPIERAVLKNTVVRALPSVLN